MSLKRSIAPLQSPKRELRPESSFPDVIEPSFDLQGPLDFDRISKRLRGSDQLPWDSGKNSPDRKGSDIETSPEADDNNTLTPLFLPSSAINIAFNGLNRHAFCYGMIHNARAKVLGLADEGFADSEPGSDFYPMKLTIKDQCVFVGAIQNENFAVLNEETTKIIQELSRSSSCRFDAYLSLEERNSLLDSMSKSEKNTFVLIDIVLYGSRVIRDSVGEVLSNARIYLQHPCHQEANTEYDNPHFLKLNALNSALRYPDGSLESSSSSLDVVTFSIPDNEPNTEVKTSAQLRRRLATVFENLTRSKKLERLEADIRITRKLLPHQEQALHFMSQRETGPTPKEFSLWKLSEHGSHIYHRHLITGSKVTECPIETVGGILADDMGLGKTLTMISTIVRTADAARLFAENSHDTPRTSRGESRLTSRSTLVIVPSPLLLDGWIQEINRHCDGSLNINIYHGKGREVDSGALADFDIVLSTYHTVAAEALDVASPLNQITWFRIVLDEAHIVRRMTTKIFQAVSKLSAKYRWCLTGTPIQNSLEDLASLIAFIQVSPLDSLADYRKHIVAPLLKGTDQGLENIRILLDSICLRRTKKLLNLPGVVYHDRHVEFSTAEMLQYNETQKEMINAIKKYDSHTRNTKGYFGIFQLQLQLRRYCNHGTYQKPAAKTTDDVQFDPEEAFTLLQKRGDAKCTLCNSPITGVNGLEEKVNGNFTVCGHLLCSECIPQFEKALRNEQDARQCSLCLQKLPGNYLVGNEAPPQTCEKPSVSGSKYFRNSGTSSKVSRIVKDIKENKTEGKSIIFSSWTKSLDLLGLHLAAEQLDFARIDGTYTLVQRQKILEKFDQNSSARILLMTLGTGAVGLNLTIANCVYLLEPQWNPMVENQAVARVLRLGQDRDVKVIRYVVNGTVEEGIRSQQTRKLDFARLGWKEDK